VGHVHEMTVRLDSSVIEVNTLTCFSVRHVGEVDLKLHSFLTWALSEDKCSVLRPGLFTREEEPTVPTE